MPRMSRIGTLWQNIVVSLSWILEYLIEEEPSENHYLVGVCRRIPHFLHKVIGREPP
jgi:hypothetical protein